MALNRSTKITLFDFSEGDNEWSYCDSAVDVYVPTYGKNYESLPIKSGTIKERSKIGDNDTFTLTIPKDSSLAQYVLARNRSNGVSLIARLLDIDTDGQTLVGRLVVRGLVVAHQEDTGTISLEIESIAQSLGDLGLRKSYSKHCTHSLYGTACGVDRALHTESVIVDSVVNLPRGGAVAFLQTNTLTPDEWKDGYIEFTVSGITLTSKIVGNQSDRLSVDINPGLTINSTTAKLVKGCDLSFTVCTEVFNNHERFGGFPYFTEDLNPFEDDTFNANAEPIVFTYELLPAGYYVVQPI